MLRFAAPALLLLLGVSAASAAMATPDACPAELAGLDAGFDETLRRLEAAWKSNDVEQKCAAIRHHIEVMRNSAEVFDRCTSGHAREENLGQAYGTIADFEDIAAELQCP